MEKTDLERQSLYIIGWLLLLIAVCYKIISSVTGIHAAGFGLPCVFHSLTGFYCPGCGGTRAVELLLAGHLLKSLYCHPLVLYGAVLYLWFMISNSIEYVSKKRIKIGMQYRRWYVIAGIVILVVNFLIKNGVMLIWHYPMLG